MNRKQNQGFTLIEIAIVLVIIGLLLGGVLKGQELINSAKVKNMATDFRNIPLYIYGYQDKFKSLPGDDPRADTNLSPSGTLGPAATRGNGVIDGLWQPATPATDESSLFWQHVRLAGLAAGSTNPADPNYFPTNADGGRIGIASGANSPITGLTGTYIICSAAILGKYVKQLDIQMDDRDTETGSMRTRLMANPVTPVAAEALGDIDDSTSYIVCLGV